MSGSSVQQNEGPPHGPGGWVAYYPNGCPVCDDEGIPIRWETERSARIAAGLPVPPLESLHGEA